ncbi:hypothetical protein [Roseomonas chloroacetimidivorans]|uniref:hypothetical protein n=1 Tax=Roseomonas chloroacetimidivorans TaxID=1766656 RepID=UPI003C75C0D6
MGLIVRIILAAGGGLAAAFLSREAPSFPVAQALFGIVVACVVLALLTLAPSALGRSSDRRDKR